MERETILLASAAAALWGLAAASTLRKRRPARNLILAAAATGMTVSAANAFVTERLGDRIRDCLLSSLELRHALEDDNGEAQPESGTEPGPPRRHPHFADPG